MSREMALAGGDGPPARPTDVTPEPFPEAWLTRD